jgi:hypothetical protein
MEDMNKKRSASSEASPRSSKTRFNKRCPVDELFAAVRNNVALVTLICSFLPIKDRVQLGQVDKQFLADEHRGQVVGVYGDDCLDTEAALEKVRSYVEYETTRYALNAFINMPDCWNWVYEMEVEPSWVAEKLRDSWFDEKLGWDLNAIEEHADFEEAQELVLEEMASVNWCHRDNQKKLEKMSVDVQKPGPLAPYNSLFDLMEKHDMETYHFLHAEEPPNCGISEDAYEINGSYLEHLRPGRMLSFRDANGKMVKVTLRACSKCKKVKDDVRDEYCGRKHCSGTITVCRQCTRYRTCFTCGATDCCCRFDQCCVRDCQNEMCHNLICDPYDDGDGQDCSFVLYPEGTDFGNEDHQSQCWKAEEHKYCKVHKPAGAIKFGGL